MIVVVVKLVVNVGRFCRFWDRHPEKKQKIKTSANRAVTCVIVMVLCALSHQLSRLVVGELPPPVLEPDLRAYNRTAHIRDVARVGDQPASLLVRLRQVLALVVVARRISTVTCLVALHL